ncbi:MAG: amino acid ABC transporter permease [Bacilli bacterium]
MNKWLELFAIAWSPLLQAMLQYTIPLAVLAFVFGISGGLLLALSKLSRLRIFRLLATMYISFFRGTPLLVQLFILFYGLPSVGIQFQPFIAAAIGLALNVAAYSAETIRASIMALPKGQWEASFMIGLSYWQTIRHVILPQALKISTPSLGNSFISLVKDTSLASAILVTELFRKGQEIAATTYEFLIIYTIVAFYYWVVSTLLSGIQTRLERKFEREGQSNTTNLDWSRTR